VGKIDPCDIGNRDQENAFEFQLQNTVPSDAAIA
jgi:hypothetical protein